MPVEKYFDFSLCVTVEALHVPNFPDGDLTFSFWIKYQPPPSQRNRDPEEEANNDNSPDRNLVSYCYDPDQQNFGPSLYIQNPGNLQLRLAGNTMRTGVNVADGNWHHVAISLQGSNVRVLRDGHAAGSGQVQRDAGLKIRPGGPLKVSYPSFNLGNNDDGESPRYVQDMGSIAGFRVWKGARTQTQIQVEMSGYLCGDPNMMLFWPLGFNQAFPATIPDASNNHNDGHFNHWGPSPHSIAGPLPLLTSLGDLSNVDLSGSDVHGIQLQKTNLSGAKLPNANLSSANLAGANLTGADLSAATLNLADLTGTILDSAKFTGVTLTHTKFSPQAAWGRSKTTRTNLQNAVVTLAVLGADWSYLDLTGCVIVDLSVYSDLSGVNASHIIYPQAPFAGCHFYSAKASRSANFDYADLTGAHLNDADLTSCSLQFTILFDADLSWSTLVSANMTHALLGGLDSEQKNTVNSASMSYAYMPGVILTAAEMYGVNLDNAQIYAYAKLDNAHLDDANLSNSILSFVDFRQAYMQGVTLTDAVLVGALLGANMSPSASGKRTSLAGAHLEGADFTGAKLFAAVLTGASIATQAGKVTTHRLDGNGNLVTVEESYDATKITNDVADADTNWPDGSQGPLTDPATQLVAPDPPQAPQCIARPGAWCPKPKKH